MSKLVNLGSHSRYRPDIVGLACGRVTTAREQLDLSRADFAAALARLLSWSPSAETVELWERCTAPPPGDVLTAIDMLTSQAHTDASAPQGGDYVSVLIRKRTLGIDDLHELSMSFDEAIVRSSVDDIMRLAHVWLVSETPQDIELRAGRRISDRLVSTTEHRVIQLRRADDFVTGRESHQLVRRELAATTKLLQDAACTQKQARRLLTALGELAQLAAWVAADSDEHQAAYGYVRGGVLAARAACDAPLVGNILSTFSYQIANTGNPHNAAILARTAYTGAKRQATPKTRALLLERIAWADAKSGDLRSCERALGAVNDSFSRGPRDNDPDWVYWLNLDEVDVMAGRCYTELKLPDRAEPLLREAISRYDETLTRENILYLSWLAESYVELSDIDQAASVALQAAQLAVHTGSARANDRLRYLATLLGPYRSVAAVGEFLDFCQDQSNQQQRC